MATEMNDASNSCGGPVRVPTSYVLGTRIGYALGHGRGTPHPLTIGVPLDHSVALTAPDIGQDYPTYSNLCLQSKHPPPSLSGIRALRGEPTPWGTSSKRSLVFRRA